MSSTRLAWLLVVALAACRQAPPPKEYQLTGQILAIKPESQEVLVKHEDIPGFMMAMTMPYKVSRTELLADKKAGDLITATLVVGETTAVLSTITTTGHAEIDASAVQPEVSALDLLKPGDQIPDAPLLGEDGTAFSLASYRGRRLALTFIYTRCPDAEFCPLMSQHFQAVQRAIQGGTGLDDAALLSISFDPDFDTPAVLRTYAKSLGADPAVWRHATATAADVAALARRFGVTVTRTESTSLVHNLATAVIGADGRIRAIHSTSRWTPADLIAELKATPPGR